MHELRLIFPSQILPDEDCAEAYALNSLAVLYSPPSGELSDTGGLEKPLPFQVLLGINRGVFSGMRKQKNEDSRNEPFSGKKIIVKT